ncbi:MAG: hypothetical protein HC794_05515 [Nitrospiraceae bacterium]|nr:hypothetical protein [Nitrospiraceae bacterium]
MTGETADKQIASGIVEIDGADVVALFRRDGASRKPALVRRFRRSKKTEWEWITRPTDGVAVTASDVIILRKEFERCERAWGLFETSGADSGTKVSNQAKRPAGPGAPPKHDWDAFAGAIARRVHDHGMPVSQGELVRDMMDWFAGREDFPAARRTHRAAEGVGDLEGVVLERITMNNRERPFRDLFRHSDNRCRRSST